MNIQDVAANLAKKKQPEVEPVAAPVEPVPTPVAAAPEGQTSDGAKFLYKALIGLAPTLIGALAGGSAGGAIGAKAGESGLKSWSDIDKEKETKAEKAKESALASSKELKAEKLGAEKFAFEKSKFAQEQKTKALELGMKQAEALAKGEKPEKPSGDQSKAALFARRMEQSENILSDLADSGFDRTSLMSGIQSSLPNAITPAASQAQEQAERNFVNAVLRRESGAAISPTEFNSAELQYFPRVGDEPQVVENKKANRQQAILGLQGEAGPVALQRVPLVGAPQQSAGSGMNKDLMQAMQMMSDSGNTAHAAIPIDTSHFDKMSTEELKKYLGK